MESPEYDGYAATASQRHREAQEAGWEQQVEQAGAAGGTGSGAASREGSRHGARAGSASGVEAAAVPPPSYGRLFGAEAQQAPDAGAVAVEEEDLLGMSAGPTSSSTPSRPGAAAAAEAEADLLGFSGGGAAPSAAAQGLAASSSGVLPTSASSTAHIDDLFTMPSKPSGSAPRPQAASAAAAARPAAAAAAAGRSRGAGLDSMIDLGAELPAADSASFGALYQGAEVRPGKGISAGARCLLLGCCSPACSQLVGHTCACS
jgi:hypothetical protein